MTEGTFTIDDISIPEFTGVENINIKAVSDAFPDIKLISRGNQIKVRGEEKEVHQVILILDSLKDHQKKFGHLSSEEVKSILDTSHEEVKAFHADKNALIINRFGKKVFAKSPNQKKIIDALTTNDMVFAIGPAGTGKTYVSVALAVKALKARQVRKLIFTRPAVEAGENLGFLPGDLKEKIDPYLRPIFDALSDFISPEKLKMYQENNTIEIAPLAYMRGRTLNDAFIILDEAQNTTPMQLKMFLTRMGLNTKMIINGDISQIDLPKNQNSGLKDATRLLMNLKGIKFVKLDERDVTRHPLVKGIIQAYNKDDKNDK